MIEQHADASPTRTTRRTGVEPPGYDRVSNAFRKSARFLLLVGLAAATGAVGLLATALLVVNNLRDIPGDTEVGKRTLAVRLGDQRTRTLYAGMMVATFVLVPLVAGLGGRPVGAIALIAVFVARKPVFEVLSGARGPALIPVLGDTGKTQLAFGLLFTIGLSIVV